MCSFGYVRVSSKDQNESRQLLALRDMNVPKENIFIDKQSGKDFKRPGYLKMLSTIQPGDLIYIKSIDRLGRNYSEIQDEWRKLVHEKKVDIVIIDMPLLDTRKGKNLMGTFLSDIVLQVLSFVAENERENIRKRQAEGIEAAKMRGVQFGRPTTDLPASFYSAAKKWERGYISCSEAARQCGMPLTTFRRKALLLREQKST